MVKDINLENFKKEQVEIIEKEGTCKSMRIVGDTIFQCAEPFYHHGCHRSKTGRMWSSGRDIIHKRRYENQRTNHPKNERRYRRSCHSE